MDDLRSGHQSVWLNPRVPLCHAVDVSLAFLRGSISWVHLHLFIHFQLHQPHTLITIPMINCTLGCCLQISGIASTSRSIPFLYTSLLITTIVILLGSRFDGSGVNAVASIALGITDTIRGSNCALNTVFSLLNSDSEIFVKILEIELPCMRHADYMRDIRKNKFEKFVCCNAADIRKSKEWVISKTDFISHYSALHYTL